LKREGKKDEKGKKEGGTFPFFIFLYIVPPHNRLEGEKRRVEGRYHLLFPYLRRRIFTEKEKRKKGKGKERTDTHSFPTLTSSA